jgi:hypothetical protein
VGVQAGDDIYASLFYVQDEVTSLSKIKKSLLKTFY